MWYLLQGKDKCFIKNLIKNYVKKVLNVLLTN